MSQLNLKSRWIILLLILIVIPVFFVILIRQPLVKRYLQGQKANIETPRYSVLSRMPGHTLRLVDTTYLEYIADKFSIWKPEAIVDPLVYIQPNHINNAKYSISHIRFELVPKVNKLFFGISGNNGFLAKGAYSIEGDTLVVEVELDFESSTGTLSSSLTMEEAYLRTALSTLYYAHGVSTNSQVNGDTLVQIKTNIEKDIDNGQVSWPFQIN